MKAKRSGSIPDPARWLYRMHWRSFDEWTSTLPQCQTCSKSVEVWFGEKQILHCNAGGFNTSPRAVCDKYKKRKD